MQDINDIPRYLRALRLFHNAPANLLDHLTENAHILKLDKGQNLYIHGDEAKRFYIIKSGWIKLYRETLDGTQAILDVINAPNCFGESAIFEDYEYSASAQAVEKTEVISLSLSTLKDELTTNNAMALAMLQHQADKGIHKQREIEQRSLQTAPQRIGCFLLRLTDQTQTKDVKIHLPYDKTLVAARLGMKPETFSRALHKLRDETGATVQGASITIHNLHDLTDYVCAACSSEFPCKDIHHGALA